MKLKDISKKYWPLLLILLFSVFLRLIYLDRIPDGITNDELHFVLNAKSVYLEGTNLAGNWNPYSLQTIPNEESSELTFLIASPVVGPLPLNLFDARLFYAIISTLTVLIIFLLAQNLVGRIPAYFIAFAASVNPWSVYVGRTAFDSPIALFFFLLGIYVLTTSKGKALLLSAIPFFLAFFTYIATKITFLPLVFSSLFYSWFFINKKKFTRSYLIVALFSICIFTFYLYTISHQTSVSRLSEISSPTSKSVIDQVEIHRNSSLQNPLNKIFVNKLTTYAIVFINNYIGNFSIKSLFLYGENTARISLWQQGYFYYSSLFFLILGFIYLFKNNRKAWILMMILTLVSPLPEAIRNDTITTYSFRSPLIFPAFIFFIGYGLCSFIQIFKVKNTRLLIGLLLFFVYAVQIANFIDIYFYRYPVYASEAFDFRRRLLTKYISLEKEHGKEVYVVTSEPQTLFKTYIFYNNLLNKDNFSTIQKVYNTPIDQGLTYNNIHFINDSSKIPASSSATFIIRYDLLRAPFVNISSHMTIPRVSDTGEAYAILNGTTCASEDLKKIPLNLTLDDLNIEKMQASQFCQKYITKLD